MSRPSNKAILLGDAWLSAPNPFYLLPAQCQLHLPMRRQWAGLVKSPSAHQGSQLAVPSGRWLAAPYLTLRAAMTAGSSVLATQNEVSRLTALLISPLERWDRATFLWISFFCLAILLPSPFPTPLPLLLPHPVHHEVVEHSTPVVLYGGVEPTSHIALAILPSTLGLTTEGLRRQQEGEVDLLLGVEDGPEDGGHYPGPLDLHWPRHRAHGQERIENTFPCSQPVPARGRGPMKGPGTSGSS